MFGIIPSIDCYITVFAFVSMISVTSELECMTIHILPLDPHGRNRTVSLLVDMCFACSVGQ